MAVLSTFATFIYITIKGVKCSLRNDILTIYDNCKDKKQITQYELEAVMLSADLYFKLKGNSFVQSIVEKIKDFEVIEQEVVIKQKIDGTTIKINRGDVLNLSLTLSNSDGTPYTFKEGDTIVFSVYNKNKMNDDAVLLKQIVVNGEQSSVEILCTKEDTKIGELINKPVEYWYEIELNGEHTVLGYDDEGAKILMLFPEGSKVQ